MTKTSFYTYSNIWKSGSIFFLVHLFKCSQSGASLRMNANCSYAMLGAYTIVKIPLKLRLIFPLCIDPLWRYTHNENLVARCLKYAIYVYNVYINWKFNFFIFIKICFSIFYFLYYSSFRKKNKKFR